MSEIEGLDDEQLFKLRSFLGKKGNAAMRKKYTEQEVKAWREKGVEAIRRYWKKRKEAEKKQFLLSLNFLLSLDVAAKL